MPLSGWGAFNVNKCEDVQCTSLDTCVIDISERTNLGTVCWLVKKNNKQTGHRNFWLQQVVAVE